MLLIVARWQGKDKAACHQQNHRSTMKVIV
ncbi:hypothetical protein A2U01_0101471, partial [Trifolium medium]|nr:hypothetical protein [Trifolium medium]